jgi:hypothetical protein
MLNVDLVQLKEKADPILVAEALGIQMRKSGKRVEILCPSHNDKHFGSCFLTKTGYKCFACGAAGDVYRMVQAARHVEFPEAVEFIADLYGGLKKYKLEDFKDAWRPKIISVDECKTIGIINKPVYRKIGEMYNDTPEYNSGGFKTEIVFESIFENNTRYAIYELIEQNPMRALYESDKDAYATLIRDGCGKTIAKLKTLDSELNGQSNQKDIQALKERLGANTASQVIRRMIKSITSIEEKYTVKKDDSVRSSNTAYLETEAPF